MIASLYDEHITSVVGGLDGRGRGIVSAAVSQTANAPDAGPNYDHKREHAERDGTVSWQLQDKPQRDHYIWDFVFTRDDGTRFWLHPNWSDSKVAYGECSRSGDRLEPPPSGRGGSGHGQVYKMFKNARKYMDVRFDKNKKALRGQTRANARALAP